MTGSLKPLMLSELIAHGQQRLLEHGDMPVGMYTSEIGYDSNIEHNGPAVGKPEVIRKWRGGEQYFPGKFHDWYVISGA